MPVKLMTIFIGQMAYGRSFDTRTILSGLRDLLVFEQFVQCLCTVGNPKRITIRPVYCTAALNQRNGMSVRVCLFVDIGSMEFKGRVFRLPATIDLDSPESCINS